MMVNGDIWEHFDSVEGVAQRRTTSPTFFKVSTDGMIVAIEAAKKKLGSGKMRYRDRRSLTVAWGHQEYLKDFRSKYRRR